MRGDSTQLRAVAQEEATNAEARQDLFQSFLDGYNAIDAHFRKALGVSDHDKRPGFRQLLTEYKRRNPWWQDDADLHQLADLRNVVAHSGAGRSICQPTPAAVDRISRIYDHLRRPPTILQAHRVCDVLTVSPADTASTVLHLVRANDFSQFPVYDDDQFLGLITENGITRWLAQYGALPDPGAVSALDLLGAQEPYLSDGGTEYRDAEFRPSDTLVSEAIYRFFVNPVLEAVLVCHPGQEAGRPCGIMTRWDALHLSHSSLRHESL